MTRLLVLIALLWASTCVAQYTKVTGTVKDPAGVPYSYGSIAVTLSSSPATCGGLGYGPPYSAIAFDQNGAFSVPLCNNGAIIPSGTTYSFRVCSGASPITPPLGTGSQCFTVSGVTIGGLSEDISTTLNVAAPALTNISMATNIQTNPPVYPESYGAGTLMSCAINTTALQSAIYAALGCGNGLACRTNGSGLQNLNRPLVLSGLYSICGELKLYHVLGFKIDCANKLASGIVQTAANQRIFDTQSMAYGTISNCSFSTTASQTGPLIDIDYSGAQGSDLRPQNITFYDDVFSGNNAGADVGVLVAKSGGGAQGDNIRCINCYFSGFSGAGWQIGGNNTGRNAGRFYAQNAIKEQIIGGDMQGDPLYAVASYGGSYEVLGTSFENNVNGNASQTGVDMYCEAPQGAPCRAENVRSESLRLAAGGPWTIEDSALNANWAQTFDNVAGNSMPLNQLITGTWVHGDGKYYQVTVSGVFGGLPLTTPTSATATTLVNSGASYTTNAFVGNVASIMQGTDVGCWGLVTANNGTTITFSGGLQTDYLANSAITCAATPDTTSQFVIEPNWGVQMTSGAATFALFEFNAIDGPFNNGTTGTGFYLRNVQVIAGRINAGGHFEDIRTTRTDWIPGNTALENGIVPYVFQNIIVARTGRPSQFYDVPWSFARNGSGATAYFDYSQDQRGTLTEVWSHGGNGGGSALPDAWMGLNGLRVPTFTFSTLPSSSPYNANGVVVYCSDCNSTCSAGSSTGRTCFRENGAWTH